WCPVVRPSVAGVVSGFRRTVAGVVSGFRRTVAGVVSGFRRTVAGVVSGFRRTVAGVVSGFSPTVWRPDGDISAARGCGLDGIGDGRARRGKSWNRSVLASGDVSFAYRRTAGKEEPRGVDGRRARRVLCDGAQRHARSKTGVGRPHRRDRD